VAQEGSSMMTSILITWVLMLVRIHAKQCLGFPCFPADIHVTTFNLPNFPFKNSIHFNLVIQIRKFPSVVPGIIAGCQSTMEKKVLRLMVIGFPLFGKGLPVFNSPFHEHADIYLTSPYDIYEHHACAQIIKLAPLIQILNKYSWKSRALLATTATSQEKPF
jgi:hypothetical protein